MLGIVGGTGLYELEGLSDVEAVKVDTPFGKPSDDILVGELSVNGPAKKVAFLPRHGRHHCLLPSEVNYRANIWALKSVGVRQLVSVSAVGSLEENIRPGDLAVPSQYSDFTKGRRQGTFFGNGVVAHISTATPCCPALTRSIEAVARDFDVSLHTGLTYACVEGPRLGTRSESFFLKSTGSHLVGMTNVPEVFLAREAQVCYATIAVVTDYDCWREDPDDHASVEKVMALYRDNIATVKQILTRLILSEDRSLMGCACRKALEGAVLTPEAHISDEGKALLAVLSL